MSTGTEVAVAGWGLTVKLLAAACILALVAFIVWFVFIRPGQLVDAAVQADAGGKAATSQAATAGDAVATGDRVIERNNRIERITRENTIRILAAPGADGAIPAGVDAAFMAAVCLRAASLGDPACAGMPEPVAGGGAEPDAGRADPAG